MKKMLSTPSGSALKEYMWGVSFEGRGGKIGKILIHWRIHLPKLLLLNTVAFVPQSISTNMLSDPTLYSGSPKIPSSYFIYRTRTLSPSNCPYCSIVLNDHPTCLHPTQRIMVDTREIVSFYPWGHLVPQIFTNQLRTEEGGEGLDIRPSIAVTCAHIKLSKLDETVRRWEIDVDGKIVMKTRLVKREDGGMDGGVDPGMEVAVTKVVVEPISYLTGVA
ncbi:hypothetical protein D9758_016499 [Tetrapyrgos nigripes]|uniref:GTP cyclohydrolase N-terminal domain-containing protein n=1 Tax=Tetrapyrgos nigripes TaxID=182062 RepID=A0A8H5FNG2_9AGAR|nr:hypothetical protein D9758_016499 [Tetrapyrgos nigripes]